MADLRTRPGETIERLVCVRSTPAAKLLPKCDQQKVLTFMNVPWLNEVTVLIIKIRAATTIPSIGFLNVFGECKVDLKESTANQQSEIMVNEARSSTDFYRDKNALRNYTSRGSS